MIPYIVGGIVLALLGIPLVITLMKRSSTRVSSGYKMVPDTASHTDIHDDIIGPGQRSKVRSRGISDRFAPLVYEQSQGSWKMSLGRVSFWLTLGMFYLICLMGVFPVVLGIALTAAQVTLFTGVLTMMFLMTLGLLGYNLGSKFTDPMTKFIDSWHRTQTSSVQSTTVEVSTEEITS